MLGFLLGVLCITVMSVKSTGAHYNPAITVVFLCKAKQRVSSRWLGVGYLIFQFAGALFGAMYFLMMNNNSVGVEVNSPRHWSQALCTEALSSFLVIFIYISQAHVKTKITDDPCLFSMLIAMTYSFCVFYLTDMTTVFFSPVNPAIAIAIEITSKWAGNSHSLENYAIYLFGPFLGAALAGLSFELFYKPIVDQLEEPEEHEIISLFT